MRRPLAVLPRISCNDACHKARGSLGGTDYAVVVGTNVLAPMTGTASFGWGGTGGYTITITSGNTKVQLMHLSAAVGLVYGGASKTVTEGQHIGESGGAYRAPGSGSSTGPHLHAHVIYKGVRYGMEEWLQTHLSGSGTPISMTSRKIFDMPAVAKRIGTEKEEWSVAWPTFTGKSDLERGYKLTTDPEVAKWWMRLYELGQGSEDKYERDDYVAWQAAARAMYTPAGQVTVTNPTTPADLVTKTDLAAAVTAMKLAVPTVAQLAAGVREVLVKLFGLIK